MESNPKNFERNDRYTVFLITLIPPGVPLLFLNITVFQWSISLQSSGFCITEDRCICVCVFVCDAPLNCVSSLCRGHTIFLSIFPILAYVLLKQALFPPSFSPLSLLLSLSLCLFFWDAALWHIYMLSACYSLKLIFTLGKYIFFPSVLSFSSPRKNLATESNILKNIN